MERHPGANNAPGVWDVVRATAKSLDGECSVAFPVRQGMNSLAQSRSSPLKWTPKRSRLQPTWDDSAGEFILRRLRRRLCRGPGDVVEAGCPRPQRGAAAAGRRRAPRGDGARVVAADEKRGGGGAIEGSVADRAGEHLARGEQRMRPTSGAWRAGRDEDHLRRPLSQEVVGVEDAV